MNILLEPRQYTDSAIKQILEFLTGVMRVNEAGILQNIGSECLHDFRVALRRIRVLLSQVPDVIPPRTLTRLKEGFAQIGAETSQHRDLDVIIENFDKYRSLLPPSQRDDLNPAYRNIVSRRNLSQRKTCEFIQSAAYRRIMRKMQDYLGRPSPPHLPANARLPILEVANTRIWKAYKRVIRQGNAITAISPSSDLHILRKSCKKFRYLTESFANLYPADKIKLLIVALKRLQNILGEHQDLHVHRDIFVELRTCMHADALPKAGLFAIDMVITALEQQQQESRCHFDEYFRDFSGREQHKLARKLFKP